VDDIIQIKEMIKKKRHTSPSLIAKIETSEAIENLDGILKEVNNILIDRGDLSSDIGLENLPAYQEGIIDSAGKAEKKI